MVKALRPHGLTFPQYEALLLLDFSSKTGALPLGLMGRRLTIHPATVTNTIDQLESKGLVQREPHPTDRRGVLARITPNGRTAARAANASLDEIRYGLSEMDTKDAVAVARAIRNSAEPSTTSCGAR